MKVLTVELIGEALDWAVAKCEGVPVEDADYDWRIGRFARQYCNDWTLAGPIIERERIRIIPWDRRPDEPMYGQWYAGIYNKVEGPMGPSPLVAAMRCYVRLKLGEKVEIPEVVQ